MKVFLFCSGEGKRWKVEAPKDVSKHFVKIGGKKLLLRTIRLLKERNINDITIVANDDRYKIKDCKLFIDKPNSPEISTFLATAHLWTGERNIIIFGDVYFTEKAIDKIINCKKEIAFLGRTGPSVFPEYDDFWDETFAISFDEIGAKRLLNAFLLFIPYNTDEIFASSWFAYNILVGRTIPPWVFYNIDKDQSRFSRQWHTHIENEIYEEINDLTDDFDWYHRFMNWKKIYEKYKNVSIGQTDFFETGS